MPYVNTYEEIGEQNTLDRLVANTLTSFTDDRIAYIGRGALYRTNLEELHLPNCRYIGSDALSNSYSLRRLILDLNAGTPCGIENNFLNVAAPRLIVYVPDELVDEYTDPARRTFLYYNRNETMTLGHNPWHTSYIGRIYGISKIGGPHEWLEQEITDSWETIGAHISAGDAAEIYHVGMYKPVDLGSEGVINFQIIGLNQDTISGTGATAQLTWCAMTTLNTLHEMNSERDGDTIGTGTNGGWPYCSMRTYLTSTILPMFPSNVSSLMKTVSKSSTIYDPTVTGNNGLTEVISFDKLFLFSRREVCDIAGVMEENGPMYVFGPSTNKARMRKNTSNVSSGWLLRSAMNYTSFANIGGDGSIVGFIPQYKSGVIFGFCT